MTFSCVQFSSLIQTILSVLEFHQISPITKLKESRTITAGKEFRLAPKKISFVNTNFLFEKLP